MACLRRCLSSGVTRPARKSALSCIKALARGVTLLGGLMEGLLLLSAGSN